MRDHINGVAFDISTRSCEESPRWLQSKSLQITLDCSVQWSLESVNFITEVTDCFCVRTSLPACTHLKAGTNPPNKHVSSQLLIGPSRKPRRPTLQTLLPHEKDQLHAGKRQASVLLSICLSFGKAFLFFFPPNL